MVVFGKVASSTAAASLVIDCARSGLIWVMPESISWWQMNATLTGVISEQVSEAARHLMIDVSRLRFADSSSIWLLVIAARTLAGGGGSMTLIRPQPVVAKMLALVDTDQVITILGETLPGPEGSAEKIPDLKAGRLTPAATWHMHAIGNLTA